MNLKKNCHILNQHPRICLIAKFHEIMKMNKFGTKNASCGYFLGYKFKNAIVIFENSTLEFV